MQELRRLAKEKAAKIALYKLQQQRQEAEMASASCLTAVENFSGASEDDGVDEFMAAIETCFSCLPPTVGPDGYPIPVTNATKCNLVQSRMLLCLW